MELLNGHIYIHVDLGSGAVKVRASRRRVDDGTWHELVLRRNGRECKVSIDSQGNDFRTPGDATQFELDSPIYLGGLGTSYSNVNSPPAVWTATLKQGFIGCLRDLMLTNKPVDIAAFARQQDSGENLLLACLTVCSLDELSVLCVCWSTRLQHTHNTEYTLDLIQKRFEFELKFLCRCGESLVSRATKPMRWIGITMPQWRRLQ